MTATTLDPNNKTASVALSGGNLVATSSAASSVAATRTLTGLHYLEATITTLTGTPAIGLVNSSYSMSTATLLGGDANSLGYRSGGAVVANSVTLATLGAFVQGDRVGMAVDPANRLVWFRVNGGNWNGSALNNPATGVGGLDYSGMTLGRLLPAVGFSLTGAVWTMKFSTPFTDTAPTGFASVDNVQYITARSLPTPDYAVPPGVAQSFVEAAVCGFLPTSAAKGLVFPAAPITHVSGLCEEVGVAVLGRRVDVYDRVTGELLGTTTSAADGSWSVPCLGRPSVRVVGSDPTAYNSVVYDNVVPV